MVYIFPTSFGYRSVIQHVLHHHALLQHVTDIITPSVLMKPEGVALSDKHKLIIHTTQRYPIKNALLIDHWMHHLKAARSVGYQAYYVNPYTGLTNEDFEYVAHKVKANDIDGIFLSVAGVLCDHPTPQYIGAVLRDSPILDPPNVTISEGARQLLKYVYQQPSSKPVQTH